VALTFDPVTLDGNRLTTRQTQLTNLLTEISASNKCRAERNLIGPGNDMIRHALQPICHISLVATASEVTILYMYV